MNDMDVQIRQARPDDVQSVIPMIYSSGPHEFDYVFNVGDKTVRSYLSFAFPSRLGGQSYRVFTTAVSSGQVVGISAFYSGRDALRLNLGNFWNLLTFYGPRKLMKVIQRGLRMETILPPPEADAGFISQLGVKEEFRGCGIGTTLVQHLIERTRSMGLRKCVLDVAFTNPRAQELYERLGFRVIQENQWNHPDPEVQIPGQRRMELAM